MARMTVAVVPAAGRSRRMGRPKLLLPFGDGTVLGATLAALAAGGAQRIAVVGRPQDRELDAWMRDGAADELARRVPEAPELDLLRATNPDPDRGMLSSVLAGLEALGGPGLDTEESRILLVCPADLPALAPATVAAVLERAAEGAALAVPVHAGRRGHPLAIASARVREVSTLDLAVGLRQLLERHPEEIAEVPVDDPGCVRDLDTPADYDSLTGR